MKLPNQQQTSTLARFGIHPILAVIVLMVDMALSGGEVASAGASLAVSIPVAMLLGMISSFWQWKATNDSFKLACLKGFGIAVLTAIPTPLASILPIVGAVLPFLSTNQSKESSTVPGNEEEEVSPGGRPMRHAKGRDITED